MSSKIAPTDQHAGGKTALQDGDVAMATFPPPEPLDPDTDVDKEANQMVQRLNQALQQQDLEALAGLFVPDGVWRDHLALSWSFRAVHGKHEIADFLQHCAQLKGGFRLRSVSLDASTPTRRPAVEPMDPTGQLQGIRAVVAIKTAVGSGEGVLRLVQWQKEWKVFVFYTSLREIEGHEELTCGRRPGPLAYRSSSGDMNWKDMRQRTLNFEGTDGPAVLIIGAGQSGLGIAARLNALGIKNLVIEKNDRVGDNWRKRYHDLVLHDPVWFDHMPYLPFPPQWPVYAPKDKLAQFLEAYADILELNVWTKTQLEECQWDAQAGSWTVKVSRTQANGAVETRIFHPRHVIQATGHSGEKKVPDFKGMDSFKGNLLCHSKDFAGVTQDGKGKKAVIIGSCTSAHDICHDYWEHGYDVTMVQRSPSAVVSAAFVAKFLSPLYREGGPAIEDADLLSNSLSNRQTKALNVAGTKMQRELDKDILAGLEKAGFGLSFGPEESGLFSLYMMRGGGYYIDVGTSQLIADGKIKVKHGHEVAEIVPHGVRLTDGSELEADDIILATGYQNVQWQTAQLFGDAAASKLGRVWGMNKEGEMRRMWQTSGVPGLWIHGTNLAYGRYYSKLLALQIQAQELGLWRFGEL